MSAPARRPPPSTSARRPPRPAWCSTSSAACPCGAPTRCCSSPTASVSVTIRKVLASAVANAQHNDELDPEDAVRQGVLRRRGPDAASGSRRGPVAAPARSSSAPRTSRSSLGVLDDDRLEVVQAREARRTAAGRRRAHRHRRPGLVACSRVERSRQRAAAAAWRGRVDERRDRPAHRRRRRRTPTARPPTATRSRATPTRGCTTCPAAASTTRPSPRSTSPPPTTPRPPASSCRPASATTPTKPATPRPTTADADDPATTAAIADADEPRTRRPTTTRTKQENN